MSSKGKASGVLSGGVALVPRLRFAEFREAAGWTDKPLKAAATINPTNGGLPETFVYIDLESVDAGALKAKTRISRNGAPSRAQRLVERGDIIYQVVRPYQRNNLLCEFEDDEDYVASTGYAQLRAKGSNRFLYQSIHTDLFVGRVIAKCTGSNYPAINSSDLAEIHLPLPPALAEQQKIAECLDSADALIAAQGRKVEALRAHKKGLMQQLFPQEGETQPRLRFPEFEGAGDWSQTDLGRLIEIKGRIGYRGYTVEDIVDAGEGAIALSPSNISETGSLSFEKETFISWFKYNESPEIMVEKGQTLLVKTGSTYGKSAFVRDLPQECTVNPQIVVLKPISVDPYFLSLLIAGEGLQNKIEANVVGGAIPTLSQDSISKFKVLVPKISEQQRIADCLTSLDDIIAAETRKLDTLKTHKNGLMQQLFPQVGED